MAAPTSAGSPLVNEAETKASESVPICPSTPKKHCKELEEKVFNDPIHGHIRLHPLLVKIIDTPQFQRLRYIKQLGGCYFVYPGASHNRFEHSIGVAHLAGKLIENIRREQGDELGIDDRDVLCVKIAGLCHDLGHGPFSHLWGKRFLKKKWEEKGGSGEKWKHEEGSEKMLDYLIEANNLRGEFVVAGLIKNPSDEKDVDVSPYIELIKKLINPKIEYNDGKKTNWPYSELVEERKSFLFEIVANKRNEVDVDKWDYFKRDCHHLGIACSFDTDRAMEVVHVIVDKVDRLSQICFRDKEVPNMYQLFQTRLSLHRAAYQHKTSNAVECMLTEALLLADPHLMIHGHDEEGKSKELPMSKCQDKMGFFINLTDEVVQRILASPDEKLKKSQELLVRIQKRDLYRLIGQVTHSDLDLLAKTLAEDIAKFSVSGALMKDDLKLDTVFFNFGKKSFNPVDHIRFYSKDKPDVPIKMDKQHVSKMLPTDCFEEAIIRVYCKYNDEDKPDEAKRCFEMWREKHSDKDTAGHPLDGLNVVTVYAITPVKSNSTGQENRSRDDAPKPAAVQNLSSRLNKTV